MPEPRFDPDSIGPDHRPDCVMAPVMTLAEAAANCGVDPAELVRESRAALRSRPGVPT